MPELPEVPVTRSPLELVFEELPPVYLLLEELLDPLESFTPEELLDPLESFTPELPEELGRELLELPEEAGRELLEEPPLLGKETPVFFPDKL